MKRRLIAAALALTLSASIAACSTERTPESDGDTVDTLTLAMGGSTSYVQNFNPFSPTANKSPLMNLIYEPLVRVNRTDGMKVEPWLAESFDFSEDGMTLTFNLRQDVTWSDGEPFTSDDVRYTLELPTTVEGLAVAPIPDLDSIETPDEHTVIVQYSEPQYHDLANYGQIPRAIVPQHVWEEEDPVQWTNEDPVSTGAFTLDSFSPQLIRLEVRDEYWNGEFNGVEYVQIRPFASEDSGKQMILKNEVDWAGMGWQNYEDNFVGADPEHNHYWVYPAGFSTGMLYNMQEGPTTDVHVRRALYAAIDSERLSLLNNVGTAPANPTGLDGDTWGPLLPDDVADVRHEQDAELAVAELEASGYTVENGNLMKDGESFPLTLTTNSDDIGWNLFGPAMQEQWNEVLGLNVEINAVPGQQWQRDLNNGEFQMIQQYLLSGDDVWTSLNAQLNSNFVEPIGTGAIANQGRYENEEVDRLLEDMSQTLDEAELRETVGAVSRIILDEVPYAPLHSAAYFVNVNSTQWSGWPDPESASYIPHITQPVDATITIQNLTPTEGQ